MSISREEFIAKIAECLFADIQDTSPDTELEELGGWDSVGRLSIAVLLSDIFNIKVDTRQLKNCRTVADIMAIADGHWEE